MTTREKAQELASMQKVIDRWGDGTELGTLDAYEKLALRYAGKVAAELIEALDMLERIAQYDEGGFEEDYNAMSKLAFDFLASLEKEAD